MLLFLEPEMIKMLLFLRPEIIKMLLYLAPEIVFCLSPEFVTMELFLAPELINMTKRIFCQNSLNLLSSVILLPAVFCKLSVAVNPLIYGLL